jgi:molybdenum cofactor guanylyltransferase
MGNKEANRKLNRNEVLGVVLAGGLSRRMGGKDKALMVYDGQPLVLRAIDRLSPQVDRVVVSANRPLADVSARNIQLIPDCLPDHPGPLVGMLSAMDWAADHMPGIAWICSSSVDTPFVPLDLVAQLADALPTGTQAAIARSDERNHPTVGLFNVALRVPLRVFLEAGERKVGLWTGQIGAHAVSFDTSQGDPFFNVNTPEDLERLPR